MPPGDASTRIQPLVESADDAAQRFLSFIYHRRTDAGPPLHDTWASLSPVLHKSVTAHAHRSLRQRPIQRPQITPSVCARAPFALVSSPSPCYFTSRFFFFFFLSRYFFFCSSCCHVTLKDNQKNSTERACTAHTIQSLFT